MPIQVWLRDKLRPLLRRPAIRHGYLYLPPKQLRFCDSEFRDDSFFLESGRRDVKRLIDSCGLSQNSAILDIGSGQGRLALGLLQRWKNFRDYQGLDVHKPSVEWCQRWITRFHPQFVFTYVDIKNNRYNPAGTADCESLPLPSERFDIAFAYSLFTHMQSGDIKQYLKEIRRVLKPGGKALVTAFVEANVPEESINPPGYLGRETQGRLHRVRFETGYFSAMIEEAGLSVKLFEHEVDSLAGQSVFTLESTEQHS